MNKSIRIAVLGVGLLLGGGVTGVALAHGMQGMMAGPMDGGMSGHMGMHGGAQGGMMGYGPHPMMGGMGGAGMMERFGLDDEQRQAMRDLRRTHRREQLNRHADILDLGDEMQALLEQDQPDPEAVKALHGRMAAIHGEMFADSVRMRNRMQGLMTDEQRQQIQEERESPRWRGHRDGDERGPGGMMR